MSSRVHRLVIMRSMAIADISSTWLTTW